MVPPKYQRFVPHAVAGLIVLALGTAVIAIRRALKKAAAAKKAAADEAAAKEKAIVLAAPEEAPIAEAVVEKLEPEELRTRAHERAAEDPATAALVLRFWLGDGDDRHGHGAQALGSGTRIA
jgi:flagellar biosynthesis/type III secretory pathway M-ring protein FliF/YscJ